jgi:hypothetical protein
VPFEPRSASGDVRVLEETLTPPPSISPPAAHLPTSPCISSRQVPSLISAPLLDHPHSPSRPSSISAVSSSIPENILSPGDIVGEGCVLQNERIRLVQFGVPSLHDKEPSQEFAVTRALGTGSCSIVYEVRELLSCADQGNELDNCHALYGRRYVIKCIAKGNVDEDGLASPMSSVSASGCSIARNLTLSPGYYSPVTSAAPQHRYSIPCARDVFFFAATSRVYSWRESL